ncbi:hypothetical protein COV24_02880 [candidate division WWE3 bacterium CG10_big_fil_rev_8_21_14_0_10_32_10]|uniref:Uncharacterized protein n=1 Tax=candidate division WWE3 bacterium CG10_big_fil_rev_8_21_14_0_10_32_10 TaxID=1975090 RepID=A0A2H0RAJ2_UNCKA|nr:MAG: hypothetical protein COV24_02880 [candidate division WWE3 bacterium CG10_big_fil_rev_8_21_14_0_10_32_10]
MKLQFKNPTVDFFTKSYLLLFFIPFLLQLIFILCLYLWGNQYDLWEYEGVLALGIWGTVFGLLGNLVGYLAVIIFILLLQGKIMSGSKLPLSTKYYLFFLALFLHLMTMYFLFHWGILSYLPFYFPFWLWVV